jgi:hypothetical protein
MQLFFNLTLLCHSLVLLQQQGATQLQCAIELYCVLLLTQFLKALVVEDNKNTVA